MAAAATATVRRGLLYVPASSPRFLQKSTSLTADNVTYDLEDSVTPSRRADARRDLRQFLQQRHREQQADDEARRKAAPLTPGGEGDGASTGAGKKARRKGISEIAVRINAVDSGFALDDLTEVLQAPNIDTLVILKVNSAADLHFVTDVIRHTLPHRHPSSPTAPSSSTSSPTSTSNEKPQLRILALIESALSLQSLPSITSSTPLLSGLIFAAEDFAHDLSLTRTPPLTEMLFARSSIVTAARAARLPSCIDLVCTSYKGADAQRTLREEAEGGRRLGFNGKQVIHPSQLGVVESVFGVSESECEWAVRVLVGDRKAVAQGRGAWTLDGGMVDRPVVERARGLVARAEACGVDLGACWERWRGEEPE